MAYKYRYEVTDRTIFPCTEFTTYGYQAISNDYTTKLPRETRIRPPGLALTARPVQGTQVARAKRFTRYNYDTSSFCGGPPKRVTYAKYYSVVPSVSPGALQHQINWAGALRSKIVDDKVSFAESIGEWRESVVAIDNGCKVIKKAVRLARRAFALRKNRRALKKWFKSTFGRDPDNRFELQDAVSVDLMIKFGIKPNISMIEDVLQQLEIVSAARRRLQVTLTSTINEKLTSASEPVGAFEISGTKSIRAIVYVTYDLDSSGFTSGNLAEALWAGTPMSFIIDWFLGVGAYLSSFSALRGVSSLSGVLCTKETIIGVDKRLPKNDSSYQWTMQEPGLYRYRSYQRTLFSSVPYADAPLPRMPSGDLWGKLTTTLEILSTLRSNRFGS